MRREVLGVVAVLLLGGCVEEVDPSLRAERETAAEEAGVEASPAAPVEIAVVVRDCAVQVARSDAPAGAVSFQVRNEGGTQQELVLRGPQGEWQSGPVPAGETALLSVSLAPGTYQLACAGPETAGAAAGASINVQ